jgi:hypothetical protein
MEVGSLFLGQVLDELKTALFPHVRPFEHQGTAVVGFFTLNQEMSYFSFVLLLDAPLCIQAGE